MADFTREELLAAARLEQLIEERVRPPEGTTVRFKKGGSSQHVGKLGYVVDAAKIAGSMPGLALQLHTLVPVQLKSTYPSTVIVYTTMNELEEVADE